MGVVIRRANVGDVAGIISVINSVVDEKKYTTFERFTEDEERAYLKSLCEREAVFVAEMDGKIVGIQSIDNPYKWSGKMNHVGMIGTLVLDGYRGQGIGQKLTQKMIDDNVNALKYYEKLGFKNR